MRRPWTTRDGRRTQQLVTGLIDFMRRLAALVPSPYFNTVRYHGVFASRNRLHSRLPLPPPPLGAPAAPVAQTEPQNELQTELTMEGATKTADTTGDTTGNTTADTTDSNKPPAPSKHRRTSTGWAALLMRTLDIDHDFRNDHDFGFDLPQSRDLNSGGYGKKERNADWDARPPPQQAAGAAGSPSHYAIGDADDPADSDAYRGH